MTLNAILSEIGFSRTKLKARISRSKKIFALDPTMVSLCLSLFDWAKYMCTKGAIKLHTLLDYEGCLPVYVHVTDGKTSDNKAAYKIGIPSGSVVVADGGYVDFDLLSYWAGNRIDLVVRLKDNIKFIPYGERPLPEKRRGNVLKDEMILLEEQNTMRKYPEKLR